MARMSEALASCRAKWHSAIMERALSKSELASLRDVGKGPLAPEIQSAHVEKLLKLRLVEMWKMEPRLTEAGRKVLAETAERQSPPPLPKDGPTTNG
jgi:hypothetical protein